jgi:hypothetical protein
MTTKLTGPYAHVRFLQSIFFPGVGEIEAVPLMQSQVQASDAWSTDTTPIGLRVVRVQASGATSASIVPWANIRCALEHEAGPAVLTQAPPLKK